MLHTNGLSRKYEKRKIQPSGKILEESHTGGLKIG